MSLGNWNDISDYKEGNQVRWMRGGEEFFDYLLQMIRSAQKNIHFQVYIIEPDETGNLFLKELINAANRGVQVNLVVDDFGSGKFDSNEEQQLVNAGIIFKRFEPFVASGKFYVGRRMHHKILVVDENWAMVGGMNIANRYKGTADSPPWIDYAIIVKGPVCRELALACSQILERQFKPAKPKLPKIFTQRKNIDPNKVWVRIQKNDWLRNKREITKSYLKAARMAKKSITIVGGYFLPGRRFLRTLSNAAKRGVEIKIIMTHFSDVPIVKYASEYLYKKLLNNNIKIYEATTTMVHGKVAVVDETWSTIGSYNQNNLSAYLSIEMNVDVVNYEFSKNLNAHLLHVIQNECIEITSEKFLVNSTFVSKTKRWMSYRFVKLSLRILYAMNRIFRVND
jgi:cardiolipin synthase A/B